jgi:uncharacterized protein YjbK
MKHHYIKIWQEYVSDITNRKKTFEIRFNDRDYQVGDILIMAEYNRFMKSFTGYIIQCEVKYIFNNTDFGLKEGFVAMSINVISHKPDIITIQAFLKTK